MSTPMFRFNYKRIEVDESGYYYADWNTAIPLSVIAATQKKAAELAFDVSGVPRHGRGWGWRLRLVDFHQVMPAEASE
jgi:hypothetical protein